MSDKGETNTGISNTIQMAEDAQYEARRQTIIKNLAIIQKAIRERTYKRWVPPEKQ